MNSANADAAGVERKTREAFEKAAATLRESEEGLQTVTSERAEANAARSTLERTRADAASRRDAQDEKLSGIDHEIQSLAEAIAGLPDPAAKRNESDGE